MYWFLPNLFKLSFGRDDISPYAVFLFHNRFSITFQWFRTIFFSQITDLVLKNRLDCVHIRKCYAGPNVKKKVTVSKLILHANRFLIAMSLIQFASHFHIENIIFERGKKKEEWKLFKHCVKHAMKSDFRTDKRIPFWQHKNYANEITCKLSAQHVTRAREETPNDTRSKNRCMFV